MASGCTLIGVEEGGRFLKIFVELVRVGDFGR